MSEIIFLMAINIFLMSELILALSFILLMMEYIKLLMANNILASGKLLLAGTTINKKSCHRTGKSTFAIPTTQRKTQDCKRTFPFPSFANAQKKNKFPPLQPKRSTLPNRWHSI